jgi:integrase
MRQELAEFLDYCRLERRLAPLTCSAYERDVVACLAFLEREGIATLSEVRPADLRRFLADEAARRPAPSSQARTVAALKCFFRFLLENEQLERDPAQVVRTPRKREALPDVLDRRELARLLDATERDDIWKRKHDGKRERDRLLGALRVRRPASQRAARTRLGRCRPRAPAPEGAQGEGRPSASRADPPPRWSRSSSTTSASGRTIPSRRSSSACKAGCSPRRS